MPTKRERSCADFHEVQSYRLYTLYNRDGKLTAVAAESLVHRTALSGLPEISSMSRERDLLAAFLAASDSRYRRPEPRLLLGQLGLGLARLYHPMEAAK